MSTVLIVFIVFIVLCMAIQFAEIIAVCFIVFFVFSYFSGQSKEISSEVNIEKCELVKIIKENTAKKNEPVVWEYVRHVSPIKDCVKK